MDYADLEQLYVISNRKINEVDTSFHRYLYSQINWDNRIDWKLAKYFSLTFATNMIYDDQILITNKKYPDGKKGLVQFKESIAFGFTYTIASKK